MQLNKEKKWTSHLAPCHFQEEVKQETFEEAAEKYYPEYPDGVVTSEIYAFREGFVKGCKVQQDKNKYSEEEVIDSIKYTIDNFFNGKIAGLNSKEIFEQFKKK